MADSIQIEIIMRPNGKPYRPRVVSAHEAGAGVLVLGTHDYHRAPHGSHPIRDWGSSDHPVQHPAHRCPARRGRLGHALSCWRASCSFSHASTASSR